MFGNVLLWKQAKWATILVLGTVVVFGGVQGTNIQAQTSQVTIFVAIDDFAPKGRVARVDLSFLGTFPVITGLGLPRDLVCGPDGRLYTVDRKNNRGRVIRANQDGSDVTDLNIGQTKGLGTTSAVVTARALAFDPSGNLYVATDENIIWRLLGADPANGAEPVAEISFSAQGMAILTHGPFAGDLLVVDDQRVVRLAAPNFSEKSNFITFSGGGDLAGVAVNPEGDVFVTNWGGGSVVHLSPSGDLIGEFLGITHPNQITFDSVGNFYLTNQVFFSSGRTTGGILLGKVGSGRGTVTTSIRTASAKGIAVCDS